MLVELLDQPAVFGLIVIVGKLLLLVVATLIALRFSRVTVRAGLNRLFEREAIEGTAQGVSAVELQRRRDTLDDLLANSVRVIILIVAFVMALSIVQLDITPVIAGLGIAGLALSLGAQHLVRDYVAGAFVLIENQYSKGDVVRIAGASGTVEDISLRRTTLRDIDGTVHFVPHGLIQVSSNLTRTWAGIALDIPVPYEEDLAAVSEAIRRAGERMAGDPDWRRRLLEPPQVERIERLAEQGIVVHVVARVAPSDRLVAPGVLRGLILEETARDGLVLGWRPVPAKSS